MNFTLVIQMKGLVIRVIADNNPGLHSGVLDLSLPLPSHPPPLLPLTERGSEASPTVQHD